MTAIAATTAPRPDARHIVSALLGSLSLASRAAQPNHSTSNDLTAPAGTQSDRLRDEHVRWIVLRALEASGDMGARDALLLTVIHAMYPDAKLASVQAALAFLYRLHLVTVEQGTGYRRASLTAAGIAVVTHSADVPAGIARPAQVWA